MLLLIIGLILFIGLVVIHEYGHFIMARRNGVEVEEFGIFFPPRLYKKRIHSKKGDYDFTINLLPLGGFVRMKGEHDDDTGKGTFGAASLSGKTKIMAAGVVMNLITAFVLLIILSLIGIPKLIPNQFTVGSDTKIVKNEILINYIEPGSPAAKAGLKSGDQVVSLTADNCNQYSDAGGCTALTDFATLRSQSQSLQGSRIFIKYKSGGDVKYTTAQLRSTKEVKDSQKDDDPSNDKGYLGVAAVDYTIQRNTWSAPIVAGGLIAQFTKLTVQGLGKAVGGVGSIIAGTATGNTAARKNGQANASQQVSGPLGIFFILKEGGTFGYQFILMIIAVISLTLAIMNILPIPALDGGKLRLTLISRGIFKRPLSQKREELINASGFIFLLLLIGLITFVDIKRFL